MSLAPNEPYATLGKHLKYLRELQSESLAEVSGAVEIDEHSLERIESGHERPAEDVLLLLISHFNMQDQEAVQLWELAGYEGETPEQLQSEPLLDIVGGQKPVIVLLGLDARTMYSDTVDISANEAGVVLQFGQQGGQKHVAPVAKVGMSFEQAERVIASLQTALLHAKYRRGPKGLPPSTLK